MEVQTTTVTELEAQFCDGTAGDIKCCQRRHDDMRESGGAG